MKSRRILSTGAALASVLVALSSASAPSPAGIEVGEVASHGFRSPLFNALGVASLEELRGKPVLVDFWGTRCSPCVGAAVPASLKLQETFGDDLQVIFVESQESNFQQSTAFALAHQWLGGRAIWTKEAPFETGFTMLPSFVLLANDGHVLMKGNPLAQPKEIERQIAEQIKLRRSPPAGIHKCAHGAWSEFSKGRYAKALELARGAEADAAGDEVALVALRESVSTFQKQLDAQFQRVQWLSDNGYFEEVVEMLADLRKGVQSNAELEQRASELAARLDSKELAAEREASRTLARLTSKFYESGGDPLIARDLEHFAEKNPGTKAAGRALELVKLVRPGKGAR